MARVSAGIGAVKGDIGTTLKFSNGRKTVLKGAHEVVGLIGVGSRMIYLFKPLNGPLVKGVLERASHIT